MKQGPIFTAVFTIVALAAVIVAFMSNASPFVTIAEAKRMSSDQLHLAGDIIKNSVDSEPGSHVLKFRLKDENGDVITIRHTGEIPNNLSEVTRVVAIGGIQHGEFVSSKLLVKCPSKYEAERKVASN